MNDEANKFKLGIFKIFLSLIEINKEMNIKSWISLLLFINR